MKLVIKDHPRKDNDTVELYLEHVDDEVILCSLRNGKIMPEFILRPNGSWYKTDYGFFL